MNECFLFGKIINNIVFEFLYNSKNISIATSKIELRNKSIIEIYAYDNIADYMYKKLKKNGIVLIYGKIRNVDDYIKIEIKRIEVVNSK